MRRIEPTVLREAAKAIHDLTCPGPAPENQTCSHTPSDSEWHAAEVALRQVPDPEMSMWLNGFSCVNPSDKFLRETGADLLKMLRIPGKTVIEVTVS